MVDFKEAADNIKSLLRRELIILWIFSVILGFALIILQDKNKLPLGKGDFVFVAILALCVALYRPRWVFFLFISLIPLENIILTGGLLPVQLRPYQFLGAIAIVAVAVLYASKKLKFELQKPAWLDWIVFSLVPLSFLSLINSPNKNVSLKNNLILISFVVLYWLVRNFLRSKTDLLKTAFFFLGSNLVVLGYGFYQVFADKFLASSFEVMFGRPNSTFTEADWLGIYLCFSLALFLSALNLEIRFPSWKYALYIIIFSNITLLILTLSRSAWVGTAVIIFFYLLFGLYEKNNDKVRFTPREFANKFAMIFLISLISLTAIYFGKLSKFDIFDRARSAATSEQKITIACNDNKNIPPAVTDASELAKYNCRHVNLEEVEFYKSQGKTVTEIFRKDPNVLTRSQIYAKSFALIKTHPIAGIGFGTITQVLGTDERGAGLNESNIFLQVWAGSGILGLAAFVAVLGYLFFRSLRQASPICLSDGIIGHPLAKDNFEKTLNVFAILGISALIIPNLFNAGLFMGIFWLGLALVASIRNIEK